MLIIKENNDLWITRGDDGFLDIDFRQRDYPYDIYDLEEGDQVMLTVRKSKEQNIDDDNPILIQIPLTDNHFHISSSDTEDLDFGNYIYDIQITFSNGIINTVIGPNIFRVLPEVTY